MEKRVLLGNEAIARGAFEAGCHVATAYPGTPSTEILETIARDYQKIKAQWSPNEKVALEVAAGAAIGGARAIAAMKHVGLNVAADPLFTFSYTGINGGLVIVNADDPGAWSSQNEQDNRHLARAAKVPMLEPADAEECRQFTKYCFQLSEEFDRPVILRITTRTAHSQGLVTIEEPKSVEVKPFIRNPQKYAMMPIHARPRHKFIEEQHQKLKNLANTSPLNLIEWGTSKRGIITSGVAYQYVKETCPADSILKLGIVWPLPDKLLTEFASKISELYVVEELDPFIENHVKALGISVKGGKNILPLMGELSPEIVDQALNGQKSERTVPNYSSPLPPRPPQLCKHCPHGVVFNILKKLDLHVIGDIGCYTLGVLPPYSAMHSQCCMGASIGMALGMEKAHGDDFARKSVAVIGDSTFLHSGITALIDVVYNKGTTTLIILDNRITAMTGHQQNPATGRTLMGESTSELDLSQIVTAIGIKRVVTVNPDNSDSLEQIIKEEVTAREPSVIIVRKKCLLVK